MGRTVASGWGSGEDGKNLTLNCKKATPLIDLSPRKDIPGEVSHRNSPGLPHCLGEGLSLSLLI